MKVVMNEEVKYLVKDTTKDFHCKEGMIEKKDLAKDTASTKQGHDFNIFPATFLDKYEKLKRKAQIITLKDVGTIVAETGVNKNSVVIDAGSGSGALCTFLAHLCKKVTSYELREDHQKVVKENKEFLEVKNLTLKQGDVREKISEKNVDLIVLDMPDPWNALETTTKALKKGGYLVLYSPTIPQVMDTVSKIQKEYNGKLVFMKTLETIQREWDVQERKVRPKSSYINHTGFLTFVRRV